MSDLDATVTRLGAHVRYVVVRNPARSPRTRCSACQVRLATSSSKRASSVDHLRASS